MINLSMIGERIKLARLLSGLDRKDIEIKFQISYNTIQSWELGRNSLTQKGAEKLSKAFLEEGVLCSAEWLINGEGTIPSILTEDKLESQHYPHEEICILREIEAFKTINTDPIVTITPDNAMIPFLNIGDYAGGNKQFKNDINKLTGSNCIVQTADGDTLIRKLLASEKKQRYNLGCLNFDIDSPPLLMDLKLVYAAQVVWIRKRENE